LGADLLFVYKLLVGFTALRADDYFKHCLFVYCNYMGHPYKLFYNSLAPALGAKN